MGFFDTLSGTINSAAESGLDNWMRNYKQKLKNASDSQVQAKWDEVSNNYSIDERIKEATKNEMRRRGLL
ncbi:MAG: hypothetical protein K2K16_09785 [Ruminococcus sp.]|nr:hypothetical protein [Ruminococcus sp.]